jgi:peptide deformylase
MYDDLRIILYPDPRLKKPSSPVDTFDENLKKLTSRMFELMREARGVGLAAPQVGQNIRLFVMNHTGKPEDDRIYLNPILSDATGEEESEEGCLSLPGINIDVNRSRTLRMQAQSIDGAPIEEIGEGYVARIWQHETDHLNGVLLLDRMGPMARIAHRKAIKELESKWAETHGTPTGKRAKR